MVPYDDKQDETWLAFVKFTVAAGIVIAIFILGAVFSSPASPHQLPCVERSVLVEKLAEEYDERPVWMGIRQTGKILPRIYFEFWGGEESWTITTAVEGSTKLCVLGEGGGWALMLQEPQVDEESP